MQFVRDEGPSRRSVLIEVEGRRMAVASRRGDGPEDVREKVFGSPDEARRAADRLGCELIGRGYVADGAAVVDGGEPGDLYDLAEPVDPDPAPPPLPRSPAPEGTAVEDSSRPRRKRGRKAGGDRLDPKELAGPGLAALALVGMIGLLAWLATRPPSLVGTWRSTRVFAFTEGALIGPTRVVTFRRDGSVTMILEDEQLFLDGTFGREGGTLRLRFDRGNSWEVGDFDLSDTPMELEYAYGFKGGWLVIHEEDGGAIQLMRMRDGETSRIARGGPGRIGPGGGDEVPEEADSGPDLLGGRWLVTSFERDGESGDGGMAWIAFDGPTAIFARVAADGTEATSAVPFAVDVGRKPKQIDLIDGEAPRRGYFAVTGDVLTIVLNDRPGGERPAPFADGIEADRVRIVLRRESPEAGGD